MLFNGQDFLPFSRCYIHVLMMWLGFVADCAQRPQVALAVIAFVTIYVMCVK